ncbi:VCBS repeat-containing protein [Dawidia soli]|uniref:VCBS repeat-containing protein n=1 Tax=Dawidia soli TaxID=2782352 RepID=UPI0020B4368B|nr:VCBS repeat-containing protein [Dawidia soli]
MLTRCEPDTTTTPTPTLFEEITPQQSGVTFTNTVRQQGDNHVLNYPYFFNGGGVAVGDLNNDGLPDLYFSGNQVANTLYLNKGHWKFEDITAKAGVAVPQGWKTGVTLADINQDGWLDIYVCRSARTESTQRKNLLFINNHDLTFTEQAAQYGIADDSYSTQAAFFDYDKDGDPDLFVLNHSIPKYGGFSKLLGSLKHQKADKFGSRLYRNDGGKFTDVSESAGLINNVLSFGLGVAITDFNNDGWSDLYISNDFNEEDYLYINQRNGTFKNTITTATGHVSLFSMGSDAADINNDGLTDLITLDMLPESNERIKLSSGDDNYDKYNLLLEAGFHDQTMRNMLQLNNGDGTFSEVGQLAGVSNTDWSWAALFNDFDGDGWKDLYITNGYEKDYTNMQFLKFTVDEQVKARTTGTAPNLQLILDQMPSIQVGNCVFRNNGNLTFTKANTAWGITRPYKSNGAAYADLDNDGDADLVVNTLNEPAVLYRNRSVEDHKARFLTVDLRKHNAARNLAGTQVTVYQPGRMQQYEFEPVRGFQSCSYTSMQIGLGADSVDSVRIVWPDHKTQHFSKVSTVLAPDYTEATSVYTFSSATTAKPLFTATKAPVWQHIPPKVNDFKRQFLLPRMYSRSGPRMAQADVNHDGLEDLYLCAPQGQQGTLLLQRKDGTFTEASVPVFGQDKAYQDEDAAFFDADSDGDADLYVVSGGYQFQPNDVLLQDRLYLNNGHGQFTRASLPTETLAGSCIAVLDADGDKDMDLFVGTGITPGQYPLASASLLLINNGTGTFTVSTEPLLTGLGMVRDAKAADINGDGKQDLVVAGEWTPVRILVNQGGATFTDATATFFTENTSGWWNCLKAEDLDGDGDVDIVAGNYGTNNQYNVTAEHPATLVYKDFNKDDQVDPFFCYYIGDQSYPYASRDEALGQVTSLKPRFTDYTSYANATLNTMFKPEELEGGVTLSAPFLQTAYFENQGGRFVPRALPVQAQFAPVYAIATSDVDHDGDTDLILAGNETNVRVRIGRSDALSGAVLLNDGKGDFSYVPQHRSGLQLRHDTRALAMIAAGGKTLLVCGAAGQSLACYQLAPLARP